MPCLLFSWRDWWAVLLCVFYEYLASLLSEAINQFNGIDDAAELEQAKARYLGRNGRLTELLKGLGKLSPENDPQWGAASIAQRKRWKQRLTSVVMQYRKKTQDQIIGEALDVSLPGRGLGTGGLHPITLTLERIQSLFHSIGFAVASGPEIETDFYNFTALNIPENHPDRAMRDTFYVDDENNGHLLRTHTSPVQIRYMQSKQPPLKVIAQTGIPLRFRFDPYSHVPPGRGPIGR